MDVMLLPILKFTNKEDVVFNTGSTTQVGQKDHFYWHSSFQKESGKGAKNSE